MELNEIGDLSLEQFTRFARLIHEKTGINLKEHKITLLSNRLRRRLRALGLRDFDDYYRFLTRPGADEELVRFLEAVTTNETYFWRTTQNFEMLREEILPELLRQFPGQTLRFWSAGSSSGEEAYNLAIELTEGMKKNGVFEFRIEATDISQQVVDFAREARYSGRKIEKIPPAVLNRYFRPDENSPGHYIVRNDLRERVSFRVENLFESTVKDAHCVFCRNVMIYFQRSDQELLVNRFFQALRPGGFLIVGHSESLFMMNTPFEARNLKNGVAYWRRPREGA